MTDSVMRLLLADFAVFIPVLFSAWPKTRFGPMLVPMSALIPLGMALALKYMVLADATSLAAAGQAEASAARVAEGTTLLVLGLVSGVAVLATVAYRGRTPSPAPG